MADGFEIQGLEQLNKNLAEWAQRFAGNAGAALRAEAELIMTEAKQRTPVDTGALRESGHVTGPEGSDQEVKLAFGGPAADYAVYVHENLEANHPHGGQAKFLESAVLEAESGLPARLAARMAV